MSRFVAKFTLRIRRARSLAWLSAPVEVSIELTNTCNLECIHCYSSSRPFKVFEELRYPELTDLIDQLVDLKVFRLQLVGGEPFIRPDACDVVSYAKRKGMIVTCSTNGSFLDDERLRYLKQHGLDDMQISIDGADAETHDLIRGGRGSFQSATSAAARASRIGIPTTVGSTIMRQNYEQIPQIVDLALELGVSALHIMGLQPGGRGAHCFQDQALPDDAWLDIVRYFEHQRGRLEGRLALSVQGPRFALINKGMVDIGSLGVVDHLDAVFTNCDCGRARCVVDSRGNVMACDMLRSSDMNLRQTPFRTIWNESSVLTAIRNRDTGGVPECTGCELVQWCRGGCAATALALLGRLDAADPRCKIASRVG